MLRVAGPRRLITTESGCGYLGVDYSADALRIARDLAGDLPCRFEQAHVPPLPDGRFDVVLFLETMLAFPDKRALLGEVARALVAGGRFACTVEAGRPLAATERARMPDVDTIWLIELAKFTAMLCDVGLTVIWQEPCTASHHATALALLRASRADSPRMAGVIGKRALDDLIAALQGRDRVRSPAVTIPAASSPIANSTARSGGELDERVVRRQQSDGHHHGHHGDCAHPPDDEQQQGQQDVELGLDDDRRERAVGNGRGDGVARRCANRATESNRPAGPGGREAQGEAGQHDENDHRA